MTVVENINRNRLIKKGITNSNIKSETSPGTTENSQDTNNSCSSNSNSVTSFGYQPVGQQLDMTYGETAAVYANLSSSSTSITSQPVATPIELLHLYYPHYYSQMTHFPQPPPNVASDFISYASSYTPLNLAQIPHNYHQETGSIIGGQQESEATALGSSESNDDSASNDVSSSICSESAAITTTSSESVGLSMAPDSESLAAVVNFKSKSRLGGNGGAKNQKRQRTKFDNRQLEILEAAFERTHYPDINVVDRLSELLSLSVERISVWFQNRRAKYKRSAKHSNSSSSISVSQTNLPNSVKAIIPKEEKKNFKSKVNT